MRAAIYARVSTVGQSERGAPLETQEAACREFVERGGETRPIFDAGERGAFEAQVEPASAGEERDVWNLAHARLLAVRAGYEHICSGGSAKAPQRMVTWAPCRPSPATAT